MSQVSQQFVRWALLGAFTLLPLCAQERFDLSIGWIFHLPSHFPQIRMRGVGWLRNYCARGFMSKQMLTSNSAVAIAELSGPYPEVITAHEEGGTPPPVGAVCKSCFSSDLVRSRRPGMFAVAKLLGYKVYRCRQCMKRTLW